MQIIVTGGAGFIGTNLCKKLMELGHDVISIDNYMTGTTKNHVHGVTYIRGDVREFSGIMQMYDNLHPDVIFHLAAIARIAPSFDQPVEYFTTNANGTLNIVQYCAKNKVPLVYAGSSSKHSGRFKNPYTFSKDIGEDIVKLYQTHYGLESSIARFYNVYGPYQLTEGEYTTLIGKWIYNIQNNIQCEIYGNGEQRRDFTHVDDIVAALVLLIEQSAYGYDFELGRGKNYSLNEIAKILNITPVYKASRIGEAKYTLNTDTTAMNVLGWNPRIELSEYLTDISIIQ